jgi:hypothetical protein
MSSMGKWLGAFVILAAGWATQATAEDQTQEGAKTPAPTCLTAEINPVTGHALCINPLGAPVEPPPPSVLLPCKPGPHTGQAWSFQPNCKSDPTG